jgi:hypothetical protein
VQDRHELAPMVILQYVNKGKVTYYLSLTTYGNTANVNKKRVFVLFTNGTKWVRNSEKIDDDVSDGKFRCSAFIKLTPTAWTCLAKKGARSSDSTFSATTNS